MDLGMSANCIRTSARILGEGVEYELTLRCVEPRDECSLEAMLLCSVVYYLSSRDERVGSLHRPQGAGHNLKLC